MANKQSSLFGNDETVLTCSKCKQKKPITEFRRRPGRSENGKRKGRWSHCRECEASMAKLPHRRALANEATQKFRKKLRDTNLAELRRRERAANLKRLYGLKYEEYEAKLASQGGVCAICKQVEPGGRWKRRFHIDHNHKTGKIRGILCHGCNTGVGAFNEDITRLEQAIAYLKSYQ